jgi:hypothetical protein
LLLTFVLPRAINHARAIQVAWRTRPSPQPLPKKASLALNLLFFASCVFLYTSFSTFSPSNANIFILTNSRLAIPNDVLFTRLATVRPNNILLSTDEVLRERFTSLAVRKFYLRFGPSTILSCPFCTPLDPSTYLLYHFPLNIVLPHLLNFLILSLCTSAPLAGTTPSTWRFLFLTGATALGALDAWVSTTYNPPIDQHMPAPSGLFWVLSVLRPLALCIADLLAAFLLYASSTNRFLLFAPQRSANPAVIHRQTAELVNKAGLALSSAATKLRATNVARNAVVRDDALKHSDAAYWAEVVAEEDESVGGAGAAAEGQASVPRGIWDDEDVQAAIARAYGSGTIDVERVKKEADAFVRGVTQSLDQ